MINLFPSVEIGEFPVEISHIVREAKSKTKSLAQLGPGSKAPSGALRSRLALDPINGDYGQQALTHGAFGY